MGKLSLPPYTQTNKRVLTMRLGAIFVLFSWSLIAQDIQSEEALALRRIADFWQEGEYQIAKSQMEEFLAEFPESSYSDTLCVALGDLFLREKSYETSLQYYSRVRAPDLTEKNFLNRVQCLYHLQWHATLADECEAYLQKQPGTTSPERNQITYFLAIALYQQCLNAAKDSETLQQFALRAKPYFEQLSKTDLSEDVSQALAHLYCILQDYKSASAIYLDLSKKSEHSSELVFQAALLQSKYDKELALQTFDAIASQEGPHARDAAYNRLVLAFDQGGFEHIISKKEEIFHSVPSERIGLAHLIVGKSFLALKQYREATAELNAFLESSGPPEQVRPALVYLMEAAFQEDNLALLDSSIHRLKQIDSQDPELPKALFSRAQLLKNKQDIPAATAELETLLSQFPASALRPQARFEIAHLASATHEWNACRTHSHAFLKEFPTHELAPFAWRYLVRSSYELAAHEVLPAKELKEQLAYDLENMLREDHFLPPAERLDWQFLLAKTDFELKSYEETIHVLEPLLKGDASFRERPNAELLLSLAYRDGLGDELQFSEWAEKAISHQATLLPLSEQHIALFNLYISRPDRNDEAADHLYQAFELGTEIQLPNLLWLTDFAYTRSEKNPAFVPKAIRLLSHFVEKNKDDVLFLEPILLKLTKLYQQEGTGKDVELLETLVSQYRASPDLAWAHQQETKLYLGEAYLKQGKEFHAEQLFDEVAAGSTLIKNHFAASALLQSSRLKLARLPKENLTIRHPDLLKAAVQLKALVLQKSLQNEPLHLEAALDYVELQMLLEQPEDRAAKRLALLLKTKADFESQEDLLSQDYHAARPQLPDKYRLYEGYIKVFDAEIFLTQAELSPDPERKKELRAMAKALFLQITADPSEPLLRDRVEQHLKSLNENA